MIADAFGTGRATRFVIKQEQIAAVHNRALARSNGNHATAIRGGDREEKTVATALRPGTIQG
jgi:hypothetical protein